MSQAQVLDILESYDGGLTSKNIHMVLKKKGITIELGTVTTNLSKLIKGKYVLKYYDSVKMGVPKYIARKNVDKKIIKKITRLPEWMWLNCGLRKNEV